MQFRIGETGEISRKSEAAAERKIVEVETDSGVTEDRRVDQAAQGKGVVERMGVVGRDEEIRAAGREIGGGGQRERSLIEIDRGDGGRRRGEQASFDDQRVEFDHGIGGGLRQGEGRHAEKE